MFCLSTIPICWSEQELHNYFYTKIIYFYIHNENNTKSNNFIFTFND